MVVNEPEEVEEELIVPVKMQDEDVEDDDDDDDGAKVVVIVVNKDDIDDDKVAVLEQENYYDDLIDDYEWDTPAESRQAGWRWIYESYIKFNKGLDPQMISVHYVLNFSCLVH